MIDRSDELVEMYEDENPDGDRVLTEVRDYLARFVSYPSNDALIAHTLWIAHTHLMDKWDTTPRISFLSPEPGSGKTRALEASEPLVYNPILVLDVSPAYLIRKMAETDEDGNRIIPTVLYDEVDTVFGWSKSESSEKIRGVLNGGWRSTGQVGRCVSDANNNIQTEELASFAPVAMAGLGNLPDTITTRSIIVRMRKRTAGEVVEQWRQRIHPKQAQPIRARLILWAQQLAHGPLSGDFWPADDEWLPAGLRDRDADIWEPLILLADLAGGEWPALARKAAVNLVRQAKEEAGTDSLGVLLLRDIRLAFEQTEAKMLRTAELLDYLNGLDESPWSSIRKGAPMDSRRLAVILKDYGIGSVTHRVGDVTVKGYASGQFEDAWSRYLPPSLSEFAVTAVTPDTPQVNAGKCVTDVTDLPVTVTGAVTQNTPLSWDVTDVTDVTDNPERQGGSEVCDPFAEFDVEQPDDWEPFVTPPSIRDPFADEPEEEAIAG